MKRKIMIAFLSILLMSFIDGILHVPSVSTGITREAARIGETVSGMINVWGPGASEYGVDELYEVKITILEVLRGTEAWAHIQAISSSNKPPKDSFEYLLARIRFGYYAKGSPGNKAYTLKQGDFKVFSKNDQAYKAPSVLPPKPELIGRVFRSGESYEGWVPFVVAKDDDQPLLFFSGGIWFQLF
ncbi:MAG: hypothetical protein JSW12_00840 [Deltaproteobacteria bacterium]|nr:MAG: hypothetical protein JSW12_00840 [Deltaproteobacteria bacterium]